MPADGKLPPDEEPCRVRGTCLASTATMRTTFFSNVASDWEAFLMKKINLKPLVQTALLIALEIILSRFLSISTPIVKIGFSFLPIAVIAILHGPFYAAAGWALADIIGALLFPIGGYFPGFTLTALLSGLVYGVALHRHDKNIWRTVTAVLLVLLLLDLGLNTLWLVIITGKGYLALLPTRVVKCVIMLPIQIAAIWLAEGRLKKKD